MGGPTIIDHDELDRLLTNQAPAGPHITRRFEAMRVAAKALGHSILEECPPSRERSLAITALEETVMWATKAIAVHQDQLAPEAP